jgi:hypothetical protein
VIPLGGEGVGVASSPLALLESFVGKATVLAGLERVHAHVAHQVG